LPYNFVPHPENVLIDMPFWWPFWSRISSRWLYLQTERELQLSLLL